jgi:hypothetical protein
VSYQNYKIENIKLIEYRKNVKFLNEEGNDNSTDKIDIIKNVKKLENYCISNYINNTNNKLHELNKKIIENTSIIEKLNKYYTKIEYKKCEENNCNSCKSYNIIYNTYCAEHILNRNKQPIINFFKTKK